MQVIRNEQNLGFQGLVIRAHARHAANFWCSSTTIRFRLKGWLSALVEEVCAHADVAVVGLLFERHDSTCRRRILERVVPAVPYLSRDECPRSLRVAPA